MPAAPLQCNRHVFMYFRVSPEYRKLAKGSNNLILVSCPWRFAVEQVWGFCVWCSAVVTYITDLTMVTTTPHPPPPRLTGLTTPCLTAHYKWHSVSDPWVNIIHYTAQADRAKYGVGVEGLCLVDFRTWPWADEGGSTCLASYQFQCSVTFLIRWQNNILIDPPPVTETLSFVCLPSAQT